MSGATGAVRELVKLWSMFPGPWANGSCLGITPHKPRLFQSVDMLCPKSQGDGGTGKETEVICKCGGGGSGTT